MVIGEDMLVGRTLSPTPEAGFISYLQENGGDYLEIGCYNGVFISKLAIRFPERVIIGIDPFISDGHTEEPIGTILSEVEQNFLKNTSGLRNIKHFRETTKEFYERGDFKDIQNVSCVYIDGSHHYKDIVIDIDLLNKINNNHIKKIVFDDININDVIAAIEYFKIKYNDRIVGEERNNFYVDFRLR